MKKKTKQNNKNGGLHFLSFPFPPAIWNVITTMRSDEIYVGLIGAIVAILGVLAVLRPVFVEHVDVGTSAASSQNQNPNSIGESIEPNTQQYQRPPFSEPELRILKVLNPFNHVKDNGDIISPQEVIEERYPVLLRGWAEHVGLQNVMFKWNESYLLDAFQGWGLRNVRGQIHSPNFKLSTLSNKDIMIFDGLPMSDFFESANEPSAPYW
jgi:hypothetical protein